MKDNVFLEQAQSKKQPNVNIMKHHKTFNSYSVDKSYHAITIPLLNRETKITTHLNETAEKREKQI